MIPSEYPCLCGHINGQHCNSDGTGPCDVAVRPGELCSCERFDLDNRSHSARPDPAWSGRRVRQPIPDSSAIIRLIGVEPGGRLVGFDEETGARWHFHGPWPAHPGLPPWCVLLPWRSTEVRP